MALSGCQSSDEPKTCEIVHVTDLPLTIRNNALYTTANINNQDVPVLFDTGATENIIPQSIARRLGMAVNVSGASYAVGLGGETRTGVATSKGVRLGEAHGEQLDFTTIADEDWHLKNEGVLGMNFLTKYDLDIDVWGKKVGLYKSIGPCDAPYTALHPPIYAVDLTPPQESNDPLRDEENALSISPAVQVQINGVNLKAEIDTGSFHTTIYRDSARRAGLTGGATIGSIKMGGVGPRPIQGEVRFSAPIVIGPLTLLNTPVIVADQRHQAGIDMELGYDFVTRVHIWVSKSSRTLIMQYPPQPTPSETKQAIPSL